MSLLPSLLGMLQKKKQQPQPQPQPVQQDTGAPPEPAGTPKGYEGWSAKDKTLAALGNPPEEEDLSKAYPAGGAVGY